ncbi:histidine phosphotransferase [Geobacter pickeringii]|uniref:Histidine phosphotransferase n=2 Tax=Geobacter pickeringii TaxID=345632 RepID=A0A0B5BA76_9BACT|nr:histidine phosphotransferase [Geobacter pickeringii]
MDQTKQKRHTVSIDPELMDIVPTFLEYRWQDVASLQDALAHEDPCLIRKIAHNLRGAGKSFGFGAVTGIGMRLERAALTGNWSRISKFIDLLIEYLERVQPVSGR